LAALDGIGKGTIKDYFDAQNPPIEYQNSANVNALKHVLGKHLNWDVVELQKIF
jgi:hypothetical protein